MASERKIAVIGLGYVGLPVALAFGRKFKGTVGFDVDQSRIDGLKNGHDRTGATSKSEIEGSDVHFTTDIAEAKVANFFVVGVPTPVDKNNRPDLTHLVVASQLVGRALTPGGIVVYESTVYPGITEEICGPILEQASGLICGKDFHLGYSPERINPGDKHHTLERIVKVVSGQDQKTLEIVSSVYSEIIEAGVFKASSIKVAEAAKVIENTQRDINIALMNELSMIFDRLDLSTKEVLAAASTKWNFLNFSPGLVGGHCIGVDPYYLTTKAEQLGYHPQVILSGRRINDGMGAFIAQKLMKLLAVAKIPEPRIGILGVTFKENVSDLRNSRVPDMIKELREFGVSPIVHDPLVDPEDFTYEYDLELSSLDKFEALDGLIFAVAHNDFLNFSEADYKKMVKRGGVLIDVKSKLDSTQFDSYCKYWSL